MKVTKKVIANLTKCYSIAPLLYKGKEHFLVAAEKVDRCLLFDREGNQVDTVWEGPGGTMSMVQLPGSDGSFLATQQFYSPNDSKEAKIVQVTPGTDGKWEVKTLVCLPHVHRFDILERDGIHYLIACTLKSGHEHKDDWSMPGKVYAAVLPDKLDQYDENNQLELNVIKDGLLKNHGYYRVIEEGIQTALISAEQGIFQFTPPSIGGDWEVHELLSEAASDAVLVDLDGDQKKELCVLAPFHGADIRIYKKKVSSREVDGVQSDGDMTDREQYEQVYAYQPGAEFTHAIYGGPLCGKPAFVVGHRQGSRDLIAFNWCDEKQKFVSEILDHDCGPANVFHYEKDGKDILIATNREIDEVAMYTIE